LLKVVGAAFAFLFYVWFAGVRYAPQVKRQKLRSR